MSLDNDIIYAWLWSEIERQAFNPISEKDVKSWIYLYISSLKNYWGLNEYPTSDFTPKKNRIIEHSGFKLVFEFNITSADKYWVSIKDLSQKLNWIHDVDGINYFGFPRQMFLNKIGKRNLAIKQCTRKQIEIVLDSMICHPKVHHHIAEYPKPEHEIRIGGGISNPYLYLFQLRFQLCINKPEREKEKGRLTTLFMEKIKSKNPIPAGDLFRYNIANI
ncbi:MAG: hypothetical protein HQ517_04260 [SAR324 cluster bacterium]|nr:hypothetical protein [SAR324 cluster bacterium]